MIKKVAMKRIRTVLLIILLLLPGCSSRLSPESGAQSSETSLPTPPQSSEFSSETPSDTQQSSAPESSEASSEPEIPAFYEKRIARDGSPTLFEVPLEIETQGELSQMVKFGDQLLFLFHSGNWETGFTIELCLCDPSSLTVTARAKTDPYSAYPILQVIRDKIVLNETGDHRLLVYNADLHLENDYDLTGIPEGDAYLGADGETLYTFDWNRQVSEINLRTKKSRKLYDMGGSYGMDASGESFLFEMVDPETQIYCPAALSLLNGEIERIPFLMDTFWLYRAGDLWLAESSADPERWYFGTKEKIRIFRSENVNKELLESSRLLTTEGNEMTLYGPDGSYVDRVLVREMATHSPLIFWEPFAGYFFLEAENGGEGTLLFWEPDPAAKGEALPLEAPEPDVPTAGTAVSSALYERAAELGEQYRVEIRIADQCGTNYSGFEWEQATDEEMIESALDELEAALSRYPENFLPQLCYGHYPKIHLELVADLHRREEELPDDSEVNGFTSVSAFTDHLSGKYHLIVLDINVNFGLNETIYHELSHVIDQKLEWDASRRADALYSESGWLACSPEGFEYAYDYFRLPEELFDDGNEDYFVDLYARTFPTEDRARIMENAMAMPNYIAEHAGMLGKLRYYSECIRDAFDTTGWPEYTAWEIALELNENGIGDEEPGGNWEDAA